MDSQEREQDQHDLESLPTNESPASVTSDVDDVTAALAVDTVADGESAAAEASSSTNDSTGTVDGTSDSAAPTGEFEGDTEVDSVVADGGEAAEPEASAEETEVVAAAGEADVSDVSDVSDGEITEAAVEEVSSEADVSDGEIVQAAAIEEVPSEADVPDVSDVSDGEVTQAEAVEEVVAVEEVPSETDSELGAESESIPEGVEPVETAAAVETEDGTPEVLSATEVSEPDPAAGNGTGGQGEIERVLAAMHHALAELSERFSATVDHIGTLLSSPRRESAATSAEAEGADSPETLAELASESPTGEADATASAVEAAPAEGAVEESSEPQEIPVEAPVSHLETTGE